MGRKDPEKAARDAINKQAKDYADKRAEKLGVSSDEFMASLNRETDASLQQDPSRHEWGPTVEEVTQRHSNKAEHGRGGVPGSRRDRQRNRGFKSHHGEAVPWPGEEYGQAKADYERQNRQQIEDQRSYDQRIADEAAQIREKVDADAEAMRQRAQETHDRKHGRENK